MFATDRYLTIFLVTFLLVELTQGCKQKCEGKEGIPKSLRPFFTTCLSKKLAGIKLNWESLVNYVVWDDAWYYATESFYCKNKTETCWLENLQYLIKPNSYKYPYVKHCITEYMAPRKPPVSCETVESPVYRPRIYQQFQRMFGCPQLSQQYVQCLGKTAFVETARIIIRPEENFLRPSYKMGQLARFINKHRSDCRITPVGKSFLRSCTESQNQQANNTAQTGLIRRSRSLKDIIAQSNGGRINFRLTGTGTVVVQPSKPIKIKPANAPKCLSKKLQMVMRSRTVLSNVVSKCNAEENKRRSQRISAQFIVRPVAKKLPGQVGDCRGKWGEWFDNDDPESGTGDLEYLNRIRRRHRGSVCLRPTAIQARVVKTGDAYVKTGDKVKIKPTFGLSCHKYNQADRTCEDYEVRFCC